MNKHLQRIAAMLLMASALTLLSCQKWSTDEPTIPKVGEITQSFNMKLSTDVSPMTKSWDPATWVYNYSSVPQTLTLTGTGTSVGNNYSKTGVTVSALKAGTITMTILPGTYTATFETPHVRTTDIHSNQPYGGTITPGSANVGDVLDIKINNPNLLLNGSPIALTATLEDALIIVDVPSLPYVFVNKNLAGTPTPNPWLLMTTATPTYHFGYLNETPLWLSIPGTPDRNVDASGYLKGNYYHLISAFGANTVLTIPGMIPHEIIIP